MKYVALIIFLAVAVTEATAGGIGPFSAWASRANEKDRQARVQRRMILQGIEKPERERVVEAMTLGVSDEDMQVAVGVDLAGIVKEKPTMKEIGRQALGTVADLGLYYGAYRAIESAVDDDSSSRSGSEQAIHVEVVDAQAPVTVGIVHGDSNSSNNDDTGTGTSNNDTDATGD